MTPHPSKTIRDDLTQAGITISAAAAMLGINRTNLNMILNGHANVTRDLAYRLSILLHPDDEGYAYARKLIDQQVNHQWDSETVRRKALRNTILQSIRLYRGEAV